MGVEMAVAPNPPLAEDHPAKRVCREGNEEEGTNTNLLPLILDLGNGSKVLYFRKFLEYDESWNLFKYLDTQLPWCRPTLRVFGRLCLQPRESCYVAEPGLPELVYSGHKPQAHCWDDFPPLKHILDIVHKRMPGSKFNSLLLNRYKGGNDNVGWHADDEKLYGETPEIASVSFGCEREFFLKKRPNKSSDDMKKKGKDRRSILLKHGSLLVMRGNTQRDWLHSVPKRAKVEGTRINLTFRLVL